MRAMIDWMTVKTPSVLEVGVLSSLRSAPGVLALLSRPVASGALIMIKSSSAAACFVLVNEIFVDASISASEDAAHMTDPAARIWEAARRLQRFADALASAMDAFSDERRDKCSRAATASVLDTGDWARATFALDMMTIRIRVTTLAIQAAYQGVIKTVASTWRTMRRAREDLTAHLKSAREARSRETDVIDSEAARVVVIWTQSLLALDDIELDVPAALGPCALATIMITVLDVEERLDALIDK